MASATRAPAPIPRLPAGPLHDVIRRREARHGRDAVRRSLRLSGEGYERLLAAATLGIYTADRMACRLRLHPAIVWPGEWETAGPEVVTFTDAEIARVFGGAA